MKVALCISGHLRKFEKTYQSLNDCFIKKYSPDIFIHTWDTLGYLSNYRSDSTIENTYKKIDRINKIFAPKKIVIEPSSFIDVLKKEGDIYAPHLKNEPKHVGHMASMFYKIYACNELRKRFELENNIQYDWVVRSRSDLMFSQQIVLPNREKNCIWLPQLISSPGWYTDQLAIADSVGADLYSSMYFDIEEYFKNKMEFFPEKFVFWSLNKKNLNVKFFNANFYILR